MVANPGKFKSFIITKNRQDTSGINFEFPGKMIKSCTKVELLGISIDMKLTFDHHVSEVCRKAAGQLNALKRLTSYLPLNARKVLVDAFIFSYNHCPLVWYFSTAKQLQKIEKIQARALRGGTCHVCIRGCACHVFGSEISLESHIFGSKICKHELPIFWG